MDVASESRRLRRRLRDLVEDSDVPSLQIDHQLGHARGYLSQLLSGAIDLKYWHLMTILRAISCPPNRFFEEVYPLPEPPLVDPSPALDTALQVGPEVAGIYGFGIESVRELRHRLERCEAAFLAAYPAEEGGEDS